MVMCLTENDVMKCSAPLKIYLSLSIKYIKLVSFASSVYLDVTYTFINYLVDLFINRYIQVKCFCYVSFVVKKHCHVM